MTDAIKKVETPLSERWITTCVRCGHERQIFGSFEESQRRAVAMGREFRVLPLDIESPSYPNPVHVAYYPHCKYLS